MVSELVKDIGIGAGAGIAGLAIGGVAGYMVGKKKRKATKKHTSKKHKGRKLKFGSKAYRKKYLSHRRRKGKQKQPHTAGKRKDTSHRRIRYTKNNQPYIILPNGKARFISKRSVSSSKKRKGGKY